MSISVIAGDLLDANVTFLVHQCNCQTTYGKGLSKAIFDRYPDANTYSPSYRYLNEVGKMVPYTRMPGTVDFFSIGSKRYLVNLYGQNNPGKPTRSETRADRLKWFSDGLQAISEFIASEFPDSKVSIGFPNKIGCGLAGGNWPDYHRLLENFAKQNPNVSVQLYSLE